MQLMCQQRNAAHKETKISAEQSWLFIFLPVTSTAGGFVDTRANNNILIRPPDGSFVFVGSLQLLIVSSNIGTRDLMCVNNNDVKLQEHRSDDLSGSV